MNAVDAADGSVGRRREARERALSLLYESEQKGVDVGEVLETLPVDPDPYALGLVSDVAERRPELHGLIERFSRNWSLDRMPVLDRLVISVALIELLDRPDVPTAVVINEAVELAKQYSTDDSGGFVNGMLSALAAEVRPTM